MFGQKIGQFQISIDLTHLSTLMVKTPNGITIRIMHNTQGRFTWVALSDPDFPTDSGIYLQVRLDPAGKEWIVSEYVPDSNGDVQFRPDVLTGRWVTKEGENDDG